MNFTHTLRMIFSALIILVFISGLIGCTSAPDAAKPATMSAVISTCVQDGNTFIIGGDMLFNGMPTSDPRCDTLCERDGKKAVKLECTDENLICFCE